MKVLIIFGGAYLYVTASFTIFIVFKTMDYERKRRKWNLVQRIFGILGNSGILMLFLPFFSVFGGLNYAGYSGWGLLVLLFAFVTAGLYGGIWVNAYWHSKNGLTDQILKEHIHSNSARKYYDLAWHKFGSVFFDEFSISALMPLDAEKVYWKDVGEITVEYHVYKGKRPEPYKYFEFRVIDKLERQIIFTDELQDFKELLILLYKKFPTLTDYKQYQGFEIISVKHTLYKK